MVWSALFGFFTVDAGLFEINWVAFKESVTFAKESQFMSVDSDWKFGQHK